MLPHRFLDNNIDRVPTEMKYFTPTGREVLADGTVFLRGFFSGDDSPSMPVQPVRVGFEPVNPMDHIYMGDLPVR